MSLDPAIVQLLLIDMTTGTNIVWATDQYESLGRGYERQAIILPSAIAGPNTKVIQPRSLKEEDIKTLRTKSQAEVFTPSWLCNAQNNHIDDVWFSRENVFNRRAGQEWHTQSDKVRFENRPSRSWQDYVQDQRLEVSCGEAPYLVSRYDAATGAPIEISRRIGILDRKLRIVNENAEDDVQWTTWARRAFESAYGFEFQGDNLILARENLLLTYVEYMQASLGRFPEWHELVAIAHVIAWNVWQMDFRTGHVPYASAGYADELTLFDEVEDRPKKCIIRDWQRSEEYVFGASVLS